MKNGNRLFGIMIGYPFVLWAAVLTAQSYVKGYTVFQIADELSKAIAAPFTIRFTDHTLPFIIGFTVIYASCFLIYYGTKQNMRNGEEHGSAKWGNAFAVCVKLKDKRKENNIILTQNLCMGMNTWMHKLNLNVLIVGGSGSGKTRYYCKPNIMQCDTNTSFVVTDPKSELLRSTGNMLKAKGYKIKVLNLIDLEKSDGYNPFQYIREETDVILLIDNLIRNTTQKTAQENDPFWTKAETLLLQALMFMLYYEAPTYEQNFGFIMTMLGYADVREDDDDFISPLDMLYLSLEQDKPEHIAVKQYKSFKLAAGKTAKSILISVAVRLSVFSIEKVRNITTFDEMDIASLGREKTALFAVVPDNNKAFNFIVGLLYTQIISELYYQADHVFSGRLPVHVRMIFDEFANIAIPENFDSVISTMRSREISASIILQNLSQLKDIYKNMNTWESIIGCCDSILYLGGSEPFSLKYFSEQLGKETISARTINITTGARGSVTKHQNLLGRELMLPDELRRMGNEYAIALVKGFRPIKDSKFNLLKHRNIKLITDGGAKPYQHTKGDKR